MLTQESIILEYMSLQIKHTVVKIAQTNDVYLSKSENHERDYVPELSFLFSPRLRKSKKTCYSRDVWAYLGPI